MSYKNAMAGLPLGGGKAVLLADADRSKSPDLLHAFGKAVDDLGGRYITAEDVGMSVADMIEVARSTKFVAGLPNSRGDVGGDPGPHTSLGVFLGIKAAVKRALGKDSLNGLHIAMQGAGSVATGVALHACAEGAKLSIADVDQAKAQKLADATGGKVVSTDEILGLEADVISPNALGAILTEQTIAALKAPVVAGGANNQLATPEDGERLHERGILYAPDYVINAGGIINVCTEYLGDGDASLVRQRIEGIPVRLEQIWAEGAEYRPRSGGGRRRDGAKADRKGISARCTRSPTPRGSCGSQGLRPPGCCSSACSLAIGGMAAGLMLTPPDYLQGETVRILYIHVPSAWLGMAGWIGIAAASISQLVWRHPLAAVAGRAVAPAGATFAAICLITGSIWGRPTWGTWWEWDGRLTSMLVLFFLYLGYIALASAERERGGEGRIAAIYGLVGAINLPIIHYSVLWWRTLHQGESIGLTGSSIDNSILWPLPLTMVGFTCLFGAATLMRMRAELAEAKVEARMRRMGRE